MSKPTLPEIIAFMQKELDSRETAYPLRIRMGSLTKSEAEKSLALTRAALTTLKEMEAAGGVAKQALGILAKDTKGFQQGEARLLYSIAALEQIYECARAHRSDCQHCHSVALLLEEIDKPLVQQNEEARQKD